MSKEVVRCDECERLRAAHNVAVANGLVVNARHYGRMIDSHKRTPHTVVEEIDTIPNIDVERLTKALDVVMRDTFDACDHGMSAHNRSGCKHCSCRTPGFGYGTRNERDAEDIAAVYNSLQLTENNDG